MTVTLRKLHIILKMHCDLLICDMTAVYVNKQLVFSSIGRKQLEETNKLCRALMYRNDASLAHDRITTIKRKASCLWNCPKQLRQAAKHMGLSVDVFASKLLRPYPESKYS